MHRALAILEVLDNIFSFLYDTEPFTEEGWQMTWWTAWGWKEDCIFRDNGRKELSRLARSCKLFHELALDHLWQFQVSLVPLLACNPKYKCRIKTPILETPFFVSFLFGNHLCIILFL
jgi:hypothetical protein